MERDESILGRDGSCECAPAYDKYGQVVLPMLHGSRKDGRLEEEPRKVATSCSTDGSETVREGVDSFL